MGFRDDPGSIRTVRDSLNRLGEELEIGATLNVKLTTSDPSKGSAEAAVETLGQLEETDASFCALSISPTTQESLAWVAEEVAPHIP